MGRRGPSGSAPRVFGVWRRPVFVVARWLIRYATREALEGRLHDPEIPTEGRWLRSDVKRFRAAMWQRVEMLLPSAHLESLPSFGNQLNVFMAVVTTAAYQVLLDRGVTRPYATTLVADVGWKIYARMLAASAFPVRALGRPKPHQLEWTLRLLMRFPFSAPGPPGYAAKAWSDGTAFHTHWTHCPPQTFVRTLVDAGEDRGELDAFYHSWCLYDWAGADLLVDDGRRGHYARAHTLSRGDAVCDMCWSAASACTGAPSGPGRNPTSDTR